ncbi:MAG: 3-oxoacid CoA-transferase subunit A [Dehalococcoidia bacterium]|nr:3-oxoacid CoA-transferase subunit A [Dehalococcoidia bacterium]MSQ16319.1 3-oxoacid CoA-transferase subunit A [Dehalococcoidia bacterium]
MPPAQRLSDDQIARRVARELSPGQVVALGFGLPGLVPGVLPERTGVFCLSESGALGYVNAGQTVKLRPGGTPLGLAEAVAMLRGGRVDCAVVQPAQVNAAGDFSHWTTAATTGVFAPGAGLDLAAGPKRVIAMLRHTAEDGSPNIVPELTFPVDGINALHLIITDIAVLSVIPRGLELMEVAPGWRADDVSALTGVPLRRNPDMGEMTFDMEPSRFPSKVFSEARDALHDLSDGATVMIDGFAGPGGMPHCLLVALRDHGARDLTMISNTAGIARITNFGTPPGKLAIDHSILIDSKQIKKAIASYPVSPSASRPSAFELAYRRGEVELELVPQGTLAERLRAGGAGVAAFYTPTGAGTLIAQGKETRVFNGKEYVLEKGLRADFCLIRGHKADTMGNVIYKGTSRNFNSVMAPAARVTVVEVDEVVEPGMLDSEQIVTPGVYISRIVVRPPGFSPYE